MGAFMTDDEICEDCGADVWGCDCDAYCEDCGRLYDECSCVDWDEIDDDLREGE